MGLAVLALVIGTAMIASAASIVLWSASETVHVVQAGTITVTVDGTPVAKGGVISDLTLYVGGSNDHVFRVSNTGTAGVTVTLTCEVTGVHASAAIAGTQTQTIPVGGFYDYTVTVTGVSSGDSSISYSITQQTT